MGRGKDGLKSFLNVLFYFIFINPLFPQAFPSVPTAQVTTDKPYAVITREKHYVTRECAVSVLTLCLTTSLQYKPFKKLNRVIRPIK